MPDGGGVAVADQVREARAPRGWRALPWSFWAILAVGAGLRVAAFNAYSFHHADEPIQYLEQAHRLAFGYGVVPWEFRYFIRSWLIPLALAGPMRVGEWLDPGGITYLVLPRALFAMVNFTPVVAAWYLGARASRQHAIIAMAVSALWVESVLFSVQTLSESLAIACFMPAAVLLQRGASGRRIAVAGTLMALAGLLRFQYAPAIAVFAAMVAGRDWRMWKALLMGGLPVVVAGGAIDLAMGLIPYEWIVNNYRMNIADQRMLKIGGVSHWTYFADLALHLRFAAPFVLLVSLLAGKRYRPLLVAAWVNILFHQAIGHKEWRYLWFSIDILLILAAIGSVNLSRMTLFGRRLKQPRGAAVTTGLLLLWGITSLQLAASANYRFRWRNDGEESRLAGEVARKPRTCGLAVNRNHHIAYGYAFVHRPIPVYLLYPDALPSLSQPGALAPAFNAVLLDAKAPAPPGFNQSVGCRGTDDERVCAYLRPGGCTPSAASRAIEHQALMLKNDM